MLLRLLLRTHFKLAEDALFAITLHAAASAFGVIISLHLGGSGRLDRVIDASNLPGQVTVNWVFNGWRNVDVEVGDVLVLNSDATLAVWCGNAFVDIDQ